MEGEPFRDLPDGPPFIARPNAGPDTSKKKTVKIDPLFVKYQTPRIAAFMPASAGLGCLDVLGGILDYLSK